MNLNEALLSFSNIDKGGVKWRRKCTIVCLVGLKKYCTIWERNLCISKSNILDEKPNMHGNDICKGPLSNYKLLLLYGATGEESKISSND